MKTAFLVFQYLILAASALFWMFRFGAMQRDGTLLRKREHEASPIGILDIGATVFLWLVLQLMAIIPIVFLMGLSFSEMEDPMSLLPEQLLEIQAWASVMQLIAVVAAVAWIYLRHEGVEWLGTRRSLGRDLLVGAAGALLIIPPVWLIQMVAVHFIEYTHPTIDSLIDNFTFRSAVYSWIAAVAVAPVAEEFFFRGLIQGWLQRVFDYDEPKDKWLIGGPANPELDRDNGKESNAQQQLRFWSPIVITSLAFAAVHGGQGPAPIPLFFLSLGIGYLFRKTGSFVPCVIVHLALNSISMVILTLSVMHPELQPPVDVDPVPAMFR